MVQLGTHIVSDGKHKRKDDKVGGHEDKTIKFGISRWHTVAISIPLPEHFRYNGDSVKQIRLHHVIAWLLLIVMGLIVIHAPLTVFIGSRLPAIADQVKAWKELLMLAALLLIVFDYTWRRAWHTVTKDVLLWLVLAYAALHLLLIPFYHLPANAVIAGLMIDLRYVLYFALVYLFLRLYPQYKQSFIKIATLGAAIVVGFAVLQLVLPHNFLAYFGYGDKTIEPYITIDHNPAFVRENSTLRGPNPLGAYAIMVLSGLVAYGIVMHKKWAKSHRYRYMFIFALIAGFVTLAVSYSRSAWIGAAIAVLIVYVSRYRKLLNPRKVVMIAVAGFVVLALVYSARNSYFVSNVIVHNNPTTGAALDSNAGHADSLRSGAADMLANPLGSGVGSTGSASLFTDNPSIVENQFLFIAHEVGWLGLALFVAITVVVLIRLRRKRADWLALAVFASGIGLVIVGLMLPVWVDDTVSIVWWGLAAVMLIPGKVELYGTTSNKKAKRTA